MVTDGRERSATRVLPPLVAGLGLGAMAVVGASPGSPYQPLLLPGGEPSGPLRVAASWVGLGGLHGNAGLVAATIVAVGAVLAFLYLLREILRGGVTMRSVVVLVVAAHIGLLFTPLLFSRDVYSYALQGRIAADGGNPYTETAVDRPDDPFARFVGPKWVDTPAVYGPAWTSASALLARLAPDPLGLVATYRVLAVLASLAVCAGIVWVARDLWPDRAVFALAAFGANPVVLFHSVASGHNDLLVALAIVGALALVLRGHDGWAVAALTLGTLVKASAAVPLLLLVVWCVARRPEGRRLRGLASCSAVILGLTAVFAVPYASWSNPTLGMLELAGHQGWLAPSADLMRILDAAPWGESGWIARVGFAVLLAATLVVLARAVWRRAERSTPSELGAAWGWGLVFLTLLGPVLLPWYAVWYLPLVWLLPRGARAAAIGVSAALAVTLWSAEQLRFPEAFDVNVFVVHWIVAPAFLVVALLLLRDLRRRLRAGSPLADEAIPVRGTPRPSQPDDHQRVTAAAG
ncbi:MAG TPA: polyprenol phosphomannose-dependent alpha 1,6 mannosyltransferase MptB [Actinomycetota bacterium]|jgi:hypothetical protein